MKNRPLIRTVLMLVMPAFLLSGVAGCGGASTPVPSLKQRTAVSANVKLPAPGSSVQADAAGGATSGGPPPLPPDFNMNANP